MSGRLIYLDGWRRPLGRINAPAAHVTCADCGTTFPVIDGVARCNGHSIDLCPWCRADSKPWTRGRGR